MNFRIGISGLVYYAPEKGDWAQATKIDAFLPDATRGIRIPGMQDLLPHLPMLVVPQENVLDTGTQPAVAGGLVIWSLHRKLVTFEARNQNGELLNKLGVDLSAGAGNVNGIVSMKRDVDGSWPGLDAKVTTDSESTGLVAARLQIGAGSFSVSGLQSGVKHYFQGAKTALGNPSSRRALAHRTELAFEQVSSLSVVLDPLGPSAGGRIRIELQDSGKGLPPGRPKGRIAEAVISNLCLDSLGPWLSWTPEGPPTVNDMDVDFRRYFSLGHPKITDSALASSPAPEVAEVIMSGTGGIERPRCIPTCC